ncbi:hypothetical protein GC163_21620 [bacterium]|nr:hypothetical protein [bacterium]
MASKITISDELRERAQRAVDALGYSSLDEFVAHCIEQEISRQGLDDADDQVADQLRGLGYLE